MGGLPMDSKGVHWEFDPDPLLIKACVDSYQYKGFLSCSLLIFWLDFSCVC